MSKKYFFFDIDGTLTKSQSDRTIPKETLATLEALRAAGHFVAIATGRAHCMARFAMEATGITNVVCDGGHGFCLDGQLIEIKPMDREKSIAICKEALAKNLPFAVVDGDSLDLLAPNTNFDELMDMSDSGMTYHVLEDFSLDRIQKFHKIFFALTKQEETILETRHLLPYMRYHDQAFVFEPADKYEGIMRIMDYLQAPLEDVVVFGDGKNDLDMFRKAPMSIAMGNAIDELKAMATYVTDRSDNDGIGKACRHFGWIR